MQSLTALLLAACGGSTDSASSANAAGGDVETGSRAATSGPASPLPPKVPTFDSHFAAIASYDRERIVEADFTTAIGQGSTGCTVDTSSGCLAYTCPAGITSVAPPTSETPQIAPGMVSASSISIGTAVAIPLAAGYGRLDQVGVFLPGEQVHRVATGGFDIPAIDPRVTVPGAVSSFAVEGCNGAASWALPSEGAVVSWTGGADAGLFEVSLWPNASTPGVLTVIVCDYDGSAQRAKVRASVIAALGNNSTGSIGVDAYSATTVVAGATHSTRIYATRSTDTAAVTFTTASE